MGIDELNYDTAKFDAVWQRVTADNSLKSAEVTANRVYYETEIKPVPASVPGYTAAERYGKNGAGAEAARLRKFMDDAALCACYCRNIATKCNGRINKTLACVAGDERCHLKKLRAKYFILTGDAYCPAETCPPACTVSEGLRRVYNFVARAEEEYLAAAESARHDLACTYNDFACDEHRHVKSVGCLIESMMC